MITKEQIDDFQTELGLRFSPDMGGSPPSIEQMVELIDVRKALENLVIEINGIESHMDDANLKAAWKRAKALEPKNPFGEYVAPPMAPRCPIAE